MESIEQTQLLQHELLRRLSSTAMHPDRYAGLTSCSQLHCGRTECLEACWSGTRRRRLQELPAVYRLLEQTKEPIHEVRIVFASWTRSIGRLHQLDASAIKHWNRCALDTLYCPELLA